MPEMLSTMNVQASVVAEALREDPAFALCVFHEAAARRGSDTRADFLEAMDEAAERGAAPDVIAAWLREVADSLTPAGRKAVNGEEG